MGPGHSWNQVTPQPCDSGHQEKNIIVHQMDQSAVTLIESQTVGQPDTTCLLVSRILTSQHHLGCNHQRYLHKVESLCRCKLQRLQRLRATSSMAPQTSKRGLYRPSGCYRKISRRKRLETRWKPTNGTLSWQPGAMRGLGWLLGLDKISHKGQFEERWGNSNIHRLWMVLRNDYSF